jgi:hypothetical protein
MSTAAETSLKLDVHLGAAQWFGVTSTLVTGESDAVLIDGQFALSEGEQLADMVRRSGQEPDDRVRHASAPRSLLRTGARDGRVPGGARRRDPARPGGDPPDQRGGDVPRRVATRRGRKQTDPRRRGCVRLWVGLGRPGRLGSSRRRWRRRRLHSPGDLAPDLPGLIPVRMDVHVRHPAEQRRDRLRTNLRRASRSRPARAAERDLNAPGAAALPHVNVRCRGLAAQPLVGKTP